MKILLTFAVLLSLVVSPAMATEGMTYHSQENSVDGDGYARIEDNGTTDDSDTDSDFDDSTTADVSIDLTLDANSFNEDNRVDSDLELRADSGTTNNDIFAQGSFDLNVSLLCKDGSAGWDTSVEWSGCAEAEVRAKVDGKLGSYYAVITELEVEAHEPPDDNSGSSYYDLYLQAGTASGAYIDAKWNDANDEWDIIVYYQTVLNQIVSTTLHQSGDLGVRVYHYDFNQPYNSLHAAGGTVNGSTSSPLFEWTHNSGTEWSKNITGFARARFVGAYKQ